MLMFLILSLFVCLTSCAPQAFGSNSIELDRSNWNENRLLRKPEIERNIRIVGGSAAQQNQFRHIAALKLKLIGQESFCGGSVIHANFILTAAHCLDDLIEIEVIAGATNFNRGPVGYRAIVPASDTRQHPTYDKFTLRDDIGLLCLRTAISSNQIQSIQLPARSLGSQNLVQTQARQPPFIIGWGRTTDASQSLSGTLQFINLPIIDNQQCINVYNTVYNYFNPNNNICISGAQGSTCNGDSGGSASILERNGRHTLIGIVSYGSSTCEGGHPVALTRVTSYLDWISRMTQIPIRQT